MSELVTIVQCIHFSSACVLCTSNA